MNDAFPKMVGPNKFSDRLFTCGYEKLVSTKHYACSVFKRIKFNNSFCN